MTERSLFPSSPSEVLPDVEARLFPGTLPDDAVTFTVYGTARPKGSKRAYARGGRAHVVDDNSERLLEWERAVYSAVHDVVDRGAPCRAGAVGVGVDFYLPRPKNLPAKRRIDGKLVPVRHRPTKAPDLDKLVRALLDVLTGRLYLDDSQVLELFAAKDYVDRDPRPHAVVRVWPLEEGAPS